MSMKDSDAEPDLSATVAALTQERDEYMKNDDPRVDRKCDAPKTGSTANIATSGVPSPYRMWALHCPFRKDGTPVLGTFGAREQAVVILTMATWKRLCADVPQLQTTQFEVGSYE